MIRLSPTEPNKEGAFSPSHASMEKHPLSVIFCSVVNNKLLTKYR
jgi:hypothetical protein